VEHLTVVGAYGHDYVSKNAALADWRAGADFWIVTVGPLEGRYINIDGQPDNMTLHIRYDKLRKVVAVRPDPVRVHLRSYPYVPGDAMLNAPLVSHMRTEHPQDWARWDAGETADIRDEHFIAHGVTKET